jgi:hypothetical protein
MDTGWYPPRLYPSLPSSSDDDDDDEDSFASSSVIDDEEGDDAVDRVIGAAMNPSVVCARR